MRFVRLLGLQSWPAGRRKTQTTPFLHSRELSFHYSKVLAHMGGYLRRLAQIFLTTAFALVVVILIFFSPGAVYRLTVYIFLILIANTGPGGIFTANEVKHLHGARFKNHRCSQKGSNGNDCENDITNNRAEISHNHLHECVNNHLYSP